VGEKTDAAATENRAVALIKGPSSPPAAAAGPPRRKKSHPRHKTRRGAERVLAVAPS